MSLSSLSVLPPDPVLGLSGHIRADPRTGKMDLGIGVYRTADGRTPVFEAVKAAERLLVDSQVSKSYLGPDGDQEFVGALAARAFGPLPRLRGLQTIGGTGALKLAADLLHASAPSRRVLLGVPCWVNHIPIFAASNLEVLPYEIMDADGRFRPDALLNAIADARAGDVVLLQASCHNPTGFDPDPALWSEIATQSAQRGLVALIDMAYQGFGDGWTEDADPVRLLAEQVPDLLVAYSCDKNFGLYRDRIGALYVAGMNDGVSDAALSHLISLARASYSMPADHGAAVVRTILTDDALARSWKAELEGMRDRLAATRRQLAADGAGVPAFAGVGAGRGMFSLLSISPLAVQHLARDHAIYMPPSARINIASLTTNGVSNLVDAVAMVAERRAA